MMSCAGGSVNLKLSGTPWPVNACAPASDAPAGTRRLSVGFGQTGRPGAECVPRCVARRPLKMSPSSLIVLVWKSTTLGCPGRIVAPQPQYSLILAFGGSAGSSIESSPRSGTGLACGSTFSCSVGSSLLPGGHGLQRFGQARIAAGAQRDVDVAAAAARVRQAELVALLLAAEQGRHRRVAAGAAHASHHHARHAARHAGRREGGDVDPALRDRRLVGGARRGGPVAPRRPVTPRQRGRRWRSAGAARGRRSGSWRYLPVANPLFRRSSLA